MKNQWLHKVTGYVRIKISGPYPESFINQCINEGMNIWNIHYAGKNVLICSVLLDEVSYLRKLARNSDCKIRFIDKKGYPFVLQKFWRRNGIIFGCVAFFLSLFILSNMVWNVDIEGASPTVENKLEQAVSEIGIKRGAFQFFLPPPEEIQSIVTDVITDATWIGVTRKGTTYHFQVVEKDIAEREPAEAPGHIVAAHKAVIQDLFVEEGLPMVELNQVVEKGDLLVSGLIGIEGNERQVSAKGTIFGEMWYEAEISVPLERTLYAVTGQSYRRHNLHIGNWSIPIWGWNPPNFEHTKREVFESNWTVFGYELPFHYGYSDYMEAEVIEMESAVDEAVIVAKEEGKEKLKEQFTKNAEITGEKVLHPKVEDGKVIVIIHFRIVDEIGMKQPIIQGD
ncbi:sporulation protein YqfD [Evansella sp. AB-P1]|uniref:sporulation protein YqfD n=1 Tax=Evansella sp. AB-P1 TaxID=3037653 RepID=UPI0024203B15|nr:sporulation protein YqfD [Evansella sp. AB-P1]MDG5786547.1 sporulation protein YqfD [Evansella sp. AB-P1]